MLLFSSLQISIEAELTFSTAHVMRRFLMHISVILKSELFRSYGGCNCEVFSGGKPPDPDCFVSEI